MSDKLFTVDQVAERLQVSRRTVYNLIQSEQLAVIRIGHGRGAIRVTPTDLDRYLDQARYAGGYDL